MPQIPHKPNKPLVRLPSVDLFDLVPLSNRSDHLGRLVRCLTPGQVGLIGKIVDVVTAENRRHVGKDAGRRGVYYAVELANVVLMGLTWDEFLPASYMQDKISEMREEVRKLKCELTHDRDAALGRVFVN